MNKQSLSHIFWPALAGVLAALLILDRWWAPEPRTVATTPQSDSYALAVSRAAPSVVNIYTLKRVDTRRNRALEELLFGRPRSQSMRPQFEESLGSGVIMTAEGHIITNNHVIAGADEILIMLQDGRTASARVIGTDQDTDLAVLETSLPDLQPITIGDSDQAQVGDVVLAIGNPLGFGHSVTQGIVSALGRHGLQLARYEEYVQTDATIHVGNSGGALINARGELLGINTLIYTTNNGARDRRSNPGPATGIGISMAIPVNLATHVMRDLINHGEVVRGWLGLGVKASTYTSSSGTLQPGLQIVTLENNSPALQAGLELGDIITHVDGEPIMDGRLTGHRIALLRPGDVVSIAVMRGMQSVEVKATLGERRSSPNPQPAR